MNKTWPKLYKITSTGATQFWEIRVEGNKIIKRFGQVDGEIQETAPTVCEGKNIGRANETNPEQQALLEAESQWVKKQKKDYVLDANPKAGAKSDLIEGGILPMLAHKFSEHGDKLVYPCFIQPKLDGHRCEACHGGGGEQSYTLWSRTRKPINSMAHIVHALDWLECGGLSFDGELYNHDYHSKFEELTHFIRQSKPEAGCEVVQYHIYDMPLPGATFRQRLKILRRVFTGPKQTVLHLVETHEVNDEDELMLAFEDFLAQGYEGAIARNADGLYVNKRSYDLLKIKKFDDGEFEVVGVEEGKGKMAGHAIFVCETAKHQLFRAKLKGALDDLRKYWNNPKLAVGKKLTVQYQGMSNDNIPRFPVALRFRQDA